MPKAKKQPVSQANTSANDRQAAIPLADKPLTPLQVANSFLIYRDVAPVGKRSKISPAKLNKLVYIFYSWYMAQTGKRPFAERPVVANFGPVFATLRFAVEYPNIGAKDIARPIPVPKDSSSKKDPYRTEHDLYLPSIDREIDGKEAIEFTVMAHVWNAYHDMPFKEISEITHHDDGPWAKAREGAGENSELDDCLVMKRGHEGIERYLAKQKETHRSQ